MARILITGSCGFVGANLSIYLALQGHTVIGLDNLARRGSETNLDTFKKHGIQFIHGDIRCPEDYYHLQADVVLECSAQPSAIDGYNNPAYDISNNLTGLTNVLEFCRLRSAGLIFWSTNKVYSGEKINAIPFKEETTRYSWTDFQGINEDFPIDGGQHSIYGATKAASDLMVQEYWDAFRIPTVVNRFSCLAGERQWGKCAQGWVAWFAIAAELGLPIQFIGFQGKQVRDVLFIQDICRLIDAEIYSLNRIGGHVFCAGGGKDSTLSLIEAAAMVERLSGKPLSVSTIDAPRKADHRIYWTDYSKATAIMGWAPQCELEQAYAGIVRWAHDNVDLLKRLYA